jgi:CheY-like chemotaxis protein
MRRELQYKQPSIFIADDDEDDVSFVKTAISELNSNIDLRHFLNGKQLLESLHANYNNLPSFVLLDLNMPILDGRQTLKLIRQNKKLKNLRVIILSTSGHPQERELCYQTGATNYITKPYEYPKYLEVIKLLKMEWIDLVSV